MVPCLLFFFRQPLNKECVAQHWEVSENYVSYTIDTSRDRAFFDTDLSDPKYELLSICVCRWLARQLHLMNL
jgi:hypothetical protein